MLTLHLWRSRSQADTTGNAQAMRPSSFLIKMKVNRQENNLSPQGVFLVSVFMTSQVERKGPTVFFHIAPRGLYRRVPHATFTYMQVH